MMNEFNIFPIKYTFRFILIILLAINKIILSNDCINKLLYEENYENGTPKTVYEYVLKSNDHIYCDEFTSWYKNGNKEIEGVYING